MIYKRELKNIQFSYDSDAKEFGVRRTKDGTPYEMHMNKSEACAYSRFIFSMVQYYSHTKRKRTVKPTEE